MFLVYIAYFVSKANNQGHLFSYIQFIMFYFFFFYSLHSKLVHSSNLKLSFHSFLFFLLLLLQFSFPWFYQVFNNTRNAREQIVMTEVVSQCCRCFNTKYIFFFFFYGPTMRTKSVRNNNNKILILLLGASHYDIYLRIRLRQM